jgi:uncharacterized protein YjiS (DUF1127 family)
MAAVEASDRKEEILSPRSLLAVVGRLWGVALDRRKERRALVRLSRLPPHLIRDVGLEPERVYKALDGSWDEVLREPFRD